MSLTNQAPFLPRRLRGVFYGWWLVVISGFVTVLSNVPLSHAMPVWAVALEHHFRWNRTQMGFAMTLGRVEGGVMGPIEGYLSDKIGTRRMVLIGLSIGGAGFLIFSQVQNLWMFYLAYAVMALGQGFAGWIPLMTMLNNWFTRRRAIAIGWSNAGGRLGALLLVPAIAWGVDPYHDRLGIGEVPAWSVMALALGVLLLVMALPTSRLIRNRPQEYGLLPDDVPAMHRRVAATPGRRPSATRVETEGAHVDLTAAQALRTRAFWLIAIAHGLTTVVLPAIWVHLGLLLMDAGFQVQTTAWVVAIYTGVGMVFQVVAGYIGVRIPTRVGLFIFSTIQASAIVLLAAPNNLTMVFLFAVLLGVGWGGRAPLTVAVRGEYFGRASFGSILGYSTAPMNAMMLFSAPLAGYISDVRGSYTIAFLVLAALNFLGGVVFLMAKRPTLVPTPQGALAAAHPED